MWEAFYFRQKPETRRLPETIDLTLTHVDDNSVHVRDSFGHEIAFHYPLKNISFEEYDKFVDQMRNKAAPLPPIENLVMGVSKAVVDPSRANPRAEVDNSGTRARTIEELATAHGITPDEFRKMLLLARETLYERFKGRLRQ
jgi:hypothetical protein